MNKINRNNYEVFLIDYLDDNLSDSDKNMVLDFLSKNPDIKEEFESIQGFELPKVNASFNNKEDLFKSEKDKKINKSNYEDYFIAFVNDELDEDIKLELSAFINANPDLEEEFELFKKTKVKADKSIKFDEKAAFFVIDEDTQINERNFTPFAIASLEGDLSKKKQNELNKFVENNDDYKKELDLFTKTKFYADKSIVFDDKNSLKELAIITVGEFNKTNYQNAIISSLEGDLCENQEKDFQEFMAKNPFVKEEYNAFSQIFLKADKSIVFKDKDKLKAIAQPQLNRKPLYLNSYFSIAASIVAIFVFAFIFNNKLDKIYIPSSKGNIAYNKPNNIKSNKDYYTTRPDISYAFVDKNTSESEAKTINTSNLNHNTNTSDNQNNNITRGKISISKVSTKDIELIAEVEVSRSFDLNRFHQDINKASKEPKVIYADNSKSDEIMARPLMKRATETMNNFVNKNQNVKDIATGNVDSRKVLNWAIKGFNSITDSEIKFANKK